VDNAPARGQRAEFSYGNGPGAGIALSGSVDERLGMIPGDERKVTQVLLNLLSNALKLRPKARGRAGPVTEVRGTPRRQLLVKSQVGVASTFTISRAE
jgi:signal transduction histidine kinase